MVALIAGLFGAIGTPDASAAPAFYLPYPAGRAYQVTQGNFGSYSHYTTNGKYAIDFAMPSGATVSASASGKVKTVSNHSQLGRFVVIDHGGGVCTQYAHLSSASVKAGQSVARGTKIGASGNTGWSTGPHLDFRVTNCAYTSRSFSVADYGGSLHDKYVTGKKLTSKNTTSTSSTTAARRTVVKDDPYISGPSSWITCRSGLPGSVAYGGDFCTRSRLLGSRM